MISGTAGNGVVPEMPCEKVVLVYFLGGITFAEIAALKLLGKMKGKYTPNSEEENFY